MNDLLKYYRNPSLVPVAEDSNRGDDAFAVETLQRGVNEGFANEDELSEAELKASAPLFVPVSLASHACHCQC